MNLVPPTLSVFTTKTREELTLNIYRALLNREANLLPICILGVLKSLCFLILPLDTAFLPHAL